MQWEAMGHGFNVRSTPYAAMVRCQNKEVDIVGICLVGLSEMDSFNPNRRVCKARTCPGLLQ